MSQQRIEELEAENKRLSDTLLRTAASLNAAISLLEHGGKKAAWSDKVFEQMLEDYRQSLEAARAALKGKGGYWIPCQHSMELGGTEDA